MSSKFAFTRRLARVFAAAALAAIAATAATAQDVKFFRIGTGGTAGTYYPIGGLIANAISNPPGSRPCNEGGSCGVPGLVATAVASNGSVANINGITSGQMESGFTQSDVAYWAYTGTGVYEGKPKVADLRLIANLYPETIHVVARKGAGIKSVADLKGKRVSLDEPGSGTLVDARIILAAFGITEKDIKAEYLKPNQAGDKMKDGGLDAFFFVGGYPTGAISELASAGAGIELVPVTGPEVDKMLRAVRFLRARYDSRQHVQGRRRREDDRRGRAVGDVDQAGRRADLRGHEGAVERQLAQAARCRPRQGQGNSGGPGDGGRRHPVPSGRREVLQGEGTAEVAARTAARPDCDDGAGLTTGPVLFCAVWRQRCARTLPEETA